MTLSPIDPSRSERHLLAAVHRWARLNGWRRGKFGWVNGADDEATINVTWSTTPLGWSAGEIGIARNADRLSMGGPVWSCTTWIRIASAVQAVDVLVALGILPPMWSSAYALPVERYAEQVESLEEEIERLKQHVTYLLEHGSPGVMHEVDRAFYDLTVKERDFYRARSDRLGENVARLRRERDEANRRLDAVRMVKVWTNEDDKRFVFADDLVFATDPDLAGRVAKARRNSGDAA
jgi:hypothetical protein